MMEDLEELVDKTLKEEYPLYFDIITFKIDGDSNLEIQQKIYQKYYIKHSIEYISSL